VAVICKVANEMCDREQVQIMGDVGVNELGSTSGENDDFGSR